MSLHGVEYELHTVHNLNLKHPDPQSIPFLRIARCDETGLSWFHFVLTVSLSTITFQTFRFAGERCTLASLRQTKLLS